MSEQQHISLSDEKKSAFSDEAPDPSGSSAGNLNLLEAPARSVHLPPPGKPALLSPPTEKEPSAPMPQKADSFQEASVKVEEESGIAREAEAMPAAASGSLKAAEAPHAEPEASVPHASFAGLLGTLGGLSLSAALLLFAAAHFLGWSPAVRLSFFGGLAGAAFLPLLLLRNIIKYPGLHTHLSPFVVF